MDIHTVINRRPLRGIMHLTYRETDPTSSTDRPTQNIILPLPAFWDGWTREDQGALVASVFATMPDIRPLAKMNDAKLS